MSRKYFYIIPLFLFEVMIQLGFFWLAPDYDCKWIVYAFLTVMTVVHLTSIFILMTGAGARKTAAIIVAGSFVQLLLMGAAIFLLVVNAAVRSAVFLMLMLAVLYAALVTVLWISMETPSDNQGNRPRINDNAYRSNDIGGSREFPEECEHRLNAPPVLNRNYRGDTSNSSSSRDNARRTPPPIPVRR